MSGESLQKRPKKHSKSEWNQLQPQNLLLEVEKILLPEVKSYSGFQYGFGRINLKKKIADYAFLFLIAGAIILLDQLSKSWVRQNLALGEVYLPDHWLSQYARIIFWKNTGAAFGMFQDFGNVFSIFSILISAFVIYYFPQIPPQDWLIRVSMSMLLGGALGNLISRLNQGYVTDWFSVGSFPVFNVADASISVGVAVLFLGMWMQELKLKRGRAKSPDHQMDYEVNSGDASPVSEETPGE